MNWWWFPNEWATTSTGIGKTQGISYWPSFSVAPPSARTVSYQRCLRPFGGRPGARLGVGRAGTIDSISMLLYDTEQDGGGRSGQVDLPIRPCRRSKPP